MPHFGLVGPAYARPAEVTVRVPALETLVAAITEGPLAARAAIMNLQAEMLASAEAGHHRDTLADQSMRHTFVNGVYAREMRILAGTLIVGRIHKHAHLNFIQRGRALVLTEDGFRHVTAPYYFVSEPGTKRVVFAVEDTLWVTIHPTRETEVLAAEADTVVDTYEELEAFRRLQLMAEGGS